MKIKMKPRSKKEVNKNINLTWVNDKIEYDQDGTNLTTDENNNDHFSHSSLQNDFTCESCGNLYLNETLFNHHNKEYHGSTLKPPAESDDDKHEKGTMMPYRITERAVEVKSRKELTT